MSKRVVHLFRRTSPTRIACRLRIDEPLTTERWTKVTCRACLNTLAGLPAAERRKLMS